MLGENFRELRERKNRNDNPNDLFDWAFLEKGFDIYQLESKLKELLGADYKQKWAEENFKKEVFDLANGFVKNIGSPLLEKVFTDQEKNLKANDFDSIVKTLTSNGSVYKQLKNCIFAKILLVAFYVKQKPEFTKASEFHQKLLGELSEQSTNEEDAISVSFFDGKAVFAFSNTTITAGLKTREKTQESMVFKLLRQKEQDFDKMIRDLVGFRFLVEGDYNGENNSFPIFYNLITKFTQLGYEIELGEIANVNFLSEDSDDSRMNSLIENLLKNPKIKKSNNFEIGNTPTSAGAVKFATFKMTGTLKKQNEEYPFEIQIEKEQNKNEKKEQTPIVFKTRQRIQLLTRLFGKVPQKDIESFVREMVERENDDQQLDDSEKQKRIKNIIDWALENKNVKKIINSKNKSVYYIWLPVWQEWKRVDLLSEKQKDIL